jgi:hypothetical protein
MLTDCSFSRDLFHWCNWNSNVTAVVYHFCFLFGVWRPSFCSFLYSVRTIAVIVATPIAFYHCTNPHISRNKARLQITNKLKYYEFRFKFCVRMWSGHLVYWVLTLPWHQIVVVAAAVIVTINPLTPSRTAPLTSKRCILYNYSTNVGTEYFKHAL